jgi:hypothetical protein
MNIRFLVLTLALLCVYVPTGAHHSFAVHFDDDRIISIKGVVTDFRFTNPHGRIYLTVTNASGNVEQWQAETNSPNILRHRGWSKISVMKGDIVTVEGYPTRDGSNYIRITRVLFEDGRELIGQNRNLVGPSLPKKE